MAHSDNKVEFQPETQPVTPRKRAWPVLGVPAFRSLWLGSVALNLSIWMQAVAAAWLMVTMGASPLMVALVQTASSLPSFILGLPGGVMADMVDRRRYLLWVIGFMMCSTIALCAFSLTKNLSPWLLLALTFSLGCGFALQNPAWFTLQTDAAPRSLLASALTLTSVSYSSARTVGPALAGGIVSGFGISTVFLCNVVLIMVAMIAVLRSRGETRHSTLPAEDLLSGMRGALRYVRHSDVMRIQILRTIAFAFVAAALWALMPLVAGKLLDSGARGYGILLGSIGFGSVVGAMFLPRLMAHMDINRMMGLCAVAYGAATLVVAYVPRLDVMCVLLFVAGVGFSGIATTNMVALQSAVPGWVRGRTVAIYNLVFQGAMAAGSAVWGALAANISTASALTASALLMGAVLAVMWRFPARLVKEAEVTNGDLVDWAPAGTSAAPGAKVSVQIEYRIGAGDREEFIREMVELGKARRRDGASSWRLLRDLKCEDVYMERFLADSWDQYSRQRSRATVKDREAEQRVRAMHLGAEAPRIKHFVSERCL